MNRRPAVQELLNMLTAYYDDGHLITGHKQVLLHYAKTWMAFDMLSSFPIDEFCGALVRPLHRAPMCSYYQRPGNRFLRRETRLAPFLAMCINRLCMPPPLSISRPSPHRPCPCPCHAANPY